MKWCCAKKTTVQKGEKRAARKKLSAILPMILTFLATQHWLHGLLFIMLGGTASELMNMNQAAMLPFQRVMILLTVASVLWSIFQWRKAGFKPKGMTVTTVISSLVGIGYVIGTLVRSGW